MPTFTSISKAYEIVPLNAPLEVEVGMECRAMMRHSLTALASRVSWLRWRCSWRPHLGVNPGSSIGLATILERAMGRFNRRWKVRRIEHPIRRTRRRTLPGRHATEKR